MYCFFETFKRIIIAEFILSFSNIPSKLVIAVSNMGYAPLTVSHTKAPHSQISGYWKTEAKVMCYNQKAEIFIIKN